MKIIILAGGMGTRLKDVVKNLPKPMADINGRPFLEYLMENMLQYGADEFVLCVGHMREIIMDYFKSEFHGCPVKYSVEEELLGTGGAIKQAFEEFGIEDGIILNGDTFVKMDYAEFYRKMHGEKLGLALKYVENASRYGLVKTEGERVIEFTEKKDTDEAGFINAGIYYVRKDLFEGILDKKFSFEKVVLEGMVGKLKPKFCKTEDYFIDIGIPESYRQACLDFARETNTASITPGGAPLSPCGRVEISDFGEGSGVKNSDSGDYKQKTKVFGINNNLKTGILTPPPNPLPHGAGGQDTPGGAPLSPCGRVEISDFGEGSLVQESEVLNA